MRGNTKDWRQVEWAAEDRAREQLRIAGAEGGEMGFQEMPFEVEDPSFDGPSTNMRQLEGDVALTSRSDANRKIPTGMNSNFRAPNYGFLSKSLPAASARPRIQVKLFGSNRSAC